MQSLAAKITCALLFAVFHSPFSDSSKHSDIAGKKARKAVSRYKPSEGFSHFRYPPGNTFYERLVHKSKSTDTVVFLIHGGSFKVGLVDMYRRLAVKLSLMLDGAEVISVDYRLFPEYTFPCQLEDNLDYLHRISKYAEKLDRTDPYVSPCFGDFEGFPPVTLICGEAEMDESDNNTVFRKMKSVGVDVQLHKFEGMFHCFEHFSFLPESRRAYEIAIKRIKEK